MSFKSSVAKILKRDIHHCRSNLFIPSYSSGSKKTSNENATKCISHSIMESNGFISDSTASGPGLITLLPLGVRVVNKLVSIIRAEMNAIGGQEVEMPALCDLSLWTRTGRNEAMGHELLRLRDRKSKDLCLCPTHEEVVTSLVARHAKAVGFGSVVDSPPIKIYQITTKFRDESKPRHGLFRTRQFLMKDMYTFHLSESCVEKTYEEVCKSYERVFKRLELDIKKAKASVGAMGGVRSHEYHVLSEVGEDKIFVCEKCGKASSLELFSTNNIGQNDLCTGLKCEYECDKSTESQLEPKRAIECGHTFILGDRYTKQIPIPIQKEQKILMACYGIGVSRLMQACVEVHSADSKFPEWPIEIAPFQVGIIPAKSGSKDSEKSGKLLPIICEKLDQSDLFQDDIYVDDRTTSTIGSRIIDARLIGVPFIVVLGKTIQDDSVEILVNNKRISKAIDKDKLVCHFRELHLVLKQLRNDYFYKMREGGIENYFKKLANT